MREIKFRSFGKNGMIYVEIADKYLVDALVKCYRNGSLMQYTGLKDENGKEIYEGDIVLTKYSKRPTEIVYQNITYGLGFREINGELYLPSSEDLESKNIKVIGNIYQNPELLEEKLK